MFGIHIFLKTEDSEGASVYMHCHHMFLWIWYVAQNDRMINE